MSSVLEDVKWIKIVFHACMMHTCVHLGGVGGGGGFTGLVGGLMMVRVGPIPERSGMTA